jgi:hypothetical protein
LAGRDARIKSDMPFDVKTGDIRDRLGYEGSRDIPL